MAERDKIIENKVRRVDIFDFNELYRFCYTYLADEGYFVMEKKYTEKVKGEGKEVEIEWEAKKKISDYFRYIFKVNWRIVGMVKVEAEKDGKKIKMDKGDVEIKVAGIIEKDYEHKWEKTVFLKFLRGIYDKYIIKSRIDRYEDKIFQEVEEYLAQIKAFLTMASRRDIGKYTYS